MRSTLRSPRSTTSILTLALFGISLSLGCSSSSGGGTGGSNGSGGKGSGGEKTTHQYNQRLPFGVFCD